MGIINKQHTFSDGNLADPTQINTDFDDLYNEFNGNIDDNNINLDKASFRAALLVALKAVDGAGSGLDADTIDGKDNGALDANTFKGNDIDTNGDGKVNSAVQADSATNVTSTYKSNDIDSDGDGKVNSADVADALVSGISDIDILTGTIAHGETIPLPAGYTQAQCKWFVSISDLYSDTSATGNQQATLYCSADASRVVTCIWATALGNFTGTANYMIIGVK